MGKIYCVNTVDGHNIYGRQFVNLKSGRTGVLLIQLYRTNHIVRLRCTSLSHCSYCIGKRVLGLECRTEGW